MSLMLNIIMLHIVFYSCVMMDFNNLFFIYCNTVIVYEFDVKYYVTYFFYSCVIIDFNN